MNEITTVGIDLAKEVFHYVGCNADLKIEKKRKLSGHELAREMAELKPCLVAMEACSTSHYWGRCFEAMGHQVRLLPAQHVKPYRRGNKNDFNDSLAIAEAGIRPHMRTVAIKTLEQQDRQLLDTQRQQFVADRTRQTLRIRAMLQERGVTIPKGVARMRQEVTLILAHRDPAFSPLFYEQLQQAFEYFRQLDEHVEACTARLKLINKDNPNIQLLKHIPGYGEVLSSLFYSYVGKGDQYARGAHLSGALGVVPAQFSTGGKERHLGISKRGNKQLRYLLINGARAVVSRVGKKTDPISNWIRQLIHRVGFNKAVVAYANKMARIGWAVLRYQRQFDPYFAVRTGA